MEFNLQSNFTKKVGNTAATTSNSTHNKLNSSKHNKHHKYNNYNNNYDNNSIGNSNYHLSNSTSSLDSNNNIRNYSPNNHHNRNHSNNKNRRPRKPMNNLAPRFQQRAFYSQFHQSGYEPMRRANLMASSSSGRSGTNFAEKGQTNQIYSSHRSYNTALLGKRPDPEGAPTNHATNTNYNSMTNSFYGNMVTRKNHSNSRDNNNNSDNKVADNNNNNNSSSNNGGNRSKPIPNDSGTQFFEHVIFDRSDLFSDYGSDTELNDSNHKSGVSDPPASGEPLSSCSTASILNHALRVASECNKRTALSYAVIGAELESLHRLHVGRTCNEMSHIVSKTGTISDQIDKARGGLRDVAMGVRQVKEELTKTKSKKNARRRRSHQRSSQHLQNKQSPDSNSSYPSYSQSHLNSSQSDLSILSEDLNTPRYRTTSQNSCLFTFNSSTSIYEHPELASYCTMSRASVPNTSDRHQPQHFRQQSDDVTPRTPKTPRNKQNTSIDLLSSSLSSHSLLES